MFLSFRKNKETKCVSVQIEKKGRRFIFKNVQIKNIFDVVEITKNPQNPL